MRIAALPRAGASSLLLYHLLFVTSVPWPTLVLLRRQRQEAAQAAKEREAEIRRHLQRLTEEPPGLSSTPEAMMLQPQQVSHLHLINTRASQRRPSWDCV